MCHTDLCHTVLCNSLPPYGLKPYRFLCPWNFPVITSLTRWWRVGSHSLLQGIFLTQGSNLCLLHHRWILYLWVIMTSIYEFWRETIHPITDSHLINSHLICINNKVLGQVFLIWITKKQSHSPLTYSRLEPVYRTRLSWMKGRLGHFENVSRYIAKSVYC